MIDITRYRCCSSIIQRHRTTATVRLFAKTSKTKLLERDRINPCDFLRNEGWNTRNIWLSQLALPQEPPSPPELYITPPPISNAEMAYIQQDNRAIRILYTHTVDRSRITPVNRATMRIGTWCIERASYLVLSHLYNTQTESACTHWFTPEALCLYRRYIPFLKYGPLIVRCYMFKNKKKTMT
jgi:hypothetical protein